MICSVTGDPPTYTADLSAFIPVRQFSDSKEFRYKFRF